jgi:hypothetical protein
MKIHRTFEEVNLTDNKSGICPVCGKHCSRTKKFWQTISPFNINAEGFVKSREEIYRELTVKIKEWGKIPPKHEKCED